MQSKQTNNEHILYSIEEYISNADSASSIDVFLSMQRKLPLPIAIRQFLIYHDGDLEMTILNRFSRWYHNLELINPKISAFRLSILKKDQDLTETGVFVILPSNQQYIYRLLSVSFSSFWRRTIQGLVRKLYPEAMPVFFRQGEIEEALFALEKLLGAQFRVRIADVTMKGKRENRFYDTERLWTDLSISEIFANATERNLWFTSLRFTIQKQMGSSEIFRTVGTGRLYKKGEIFYDFFHSEIESSLLTTLVEHTANRLKLLSRRGIRERNYKPGFPLEIYYDDETFGDVKEIRRFGETIQKYQNATKAVFHGNPYYHASIADFLDGSSFDVWIVSPSRVIIVPQARSSPQAFERLISHILFEYKEGKVNEYTGTA